MKLVEILKIYKSFSLLKFSPISNWKDSLRELDRDKTAKPKKKTFKVEPSKVGADGKIIS